jgi:hypothetical protein
MAHGEDLTTEADIEAAIERAKNFDNHPRVLSASYNRAADAMILGLNNGTRFIIPREELKGLEGATETQLADIEISVGLALYWPQVDVEHYFPYLPLQRTGKNPWLSPSEPQAVAA